MNTASYVIPNINAIFHADTVAYRVSIGWTSRVTSLQMSSHMHQVEVLTSSPIIGQITSIAFLNPLRVTSRSARR